MAAKPPMSKIETIARCYGGKRWDYWLRLVWDRGFSHGSELVDLLGKPFGREPSGMTDNVYAAERLLSQAVEDGWLLQGEDRPTAQQKFLGNGGQWRPNGPTIRGYSPNRQHPGYQLFIVGLAEVR